ncbi:MAG: hypothetical protein EXS05_21115 [Planctomycetaceae bacterium]|nr:hypothetical protein [Planctomycetaceae bacterium]
MHSIPQAMTWEFLRRGGWWFLAAMLFMISFPALVLGSLQRDGALNPQEPAIGSLHFVLSLSQQLAFSIVVFHAHGYPGRLYAWPVPTPTLVLWQLVPGMGALLLMTLATTGFINLLFGVGWPLWGPALFIAASWPAYQAVVWLTYRRPFRMMAGLALVGFGLGLWITYRYGGAFGSPRQMWQEVTPGECLALAAVVVVAYWAAVIGVARDRRGDANGSSRLSEWIDGLEASGRAATRPLGTPARAQLWSEWQQKGWIMPILEIMLMLIALGIWLWNGLPMNDLHEGLIGVGMFIPIIGVIIGLVIGSTAPGDGKTGMVPFLATRPLTDPALAGAILRTVAGSVLLTWVCWSAVRGLALC